ncbi:MAG: insulinase family protein, partial [Minisyncoccales bacterium]
KRNLAYAVKGGSEIGKEFGHSFVYIGTTKENIDNIKKIILEEYKKVFEDFNEKELRQIKKRLIGNFKISTEDSSHQMINLLYNEIGSDAKEFYDFEKKISEITLDEIREIAKNAYDKHSFFVLEPEEQ